MGEREEDLVGELDEGFLIDGRGGGFAFSLVSGSDFFLGEDLAKKLFMDDGGTRWCRVGEKSVLGFGALFVCGAPGFTHQRCGRSIIEVCASISP